MRNFSPNKVAASEALKLNWDSRNLGPNVDMPAMSVASVAPARQSRMNVGFFRRSHTELGGGGEGRAERKDRGSEWARAGCEGAPEATAPIRAQTALVLRVGWCELGQPTSTPEKPRRDEAGLWLLDNEHRECTPATCCENC